MATEEANWTWLPYDLLELISDRLIEHSDYLRFSLVCKYWHSVASNQKTKHIRSPLFRKQFPFVLVPNKADGSTKETRSLYCLRSQRKICDLSLPSQYTSECFGSPYRWIAARERRTKEIFLINPLTIEEITLPLIRRHIFYPEVIHKIVLSSDPSLTPDNYVVAAIYRCVYLSNLAYIKPGDEAWTHIETDRFSRIKDVLFHQNLLYAVDSKNKLLALDVFGEYVNHPPQPRVIVDQNGGEDLQGEKFLVESTAGDLLLVLWTWQKLDEASMVMPHPLKSVFRVFKLRESSWVKIDSLGNDALFLGGSDASFSLPASSFRGCQPDSIYAICGRKSRFYIVAFDMKTKTMRRMHTVDRYLLGRWPLWFMPALE